MFVDSARNSIAMAEQMPIHLQKPKIISIGKRKVRSVSLLRKHCTAPEVILHSGECGVSIKVKVENQKLIVEKKKNKPKSFFPPVRFLKTSPNVQENEKWFY